MEHIMPKDIVVFPENTIGVDFVIGDLHGNANCLNEAINVLQENDRLFIVGDLTDRGKDNIEVMKLLQENQERVIAIKGNHENLTLNAISGLENMAREPKDIVHQTEEYLKEQMITKLESIFNLYHDKNKNKQQKQDTFQRDYGNEVNSVWNHIKNGGIWLDKLFYEELKSGKIIMSTGEDGEKLLTYNADSDVKMIKDYMNSLPYIVHVQGNNRFNMVHADMPINDQELQRRISNNEELTNAERGYATWAREGKPGKVINYTFQDKGRTDTSILTIVGHSIVAKGAAPVVREKTNTIDIDVGTYSNDVSLLVNVTHGTCKFIGPKIEDALCNQHLINVQTKLGQHLIKINSINNEACSVLNELRNTIEQNHWNTGFYGFNMLGGGKTVQISGINKILPNRIAAIYETINNFAIPPFERLVTIKKIATEAITCPGVFQQQETYSFYKNIVDNKGVLEDKNEITSIMKNKLQDIKAQEEQTKPSITKNI